jgi:NADH dehydrogenase/NADH:ubiquinone oxidoreductase subunit G
VHVHCSPQDLANRLGSGSTWHEGGFPELDADVRSTYTANTTVAGLEVADVILLIGTNPRVESPVYNARIRKSWLDGAQVRLSVRAVNGANCTLRWYQDAYVSCSIAVADCMRGVLA